MVCIAFILFVYLWPPLMGTPVKSINPVVLDVIHVVFLCALVGVLPSPFVLLYSAGGLMNMAVTIANGGVMPVVLSAVRYPGTVQNLDARHVVAGPGHRLLWLSDWIETPWSFYSPGDIVVSAAFIVVAFNMVLLGIRLLRSRGAGSA